MREKLAVLEGTRTLFRATFVRFGSRLALDGQLITTILLCDVTRRGRVIEDHIWCDCGESFEQVSLQVGDVVEFHARVTSYVKSYKGRRKDEALDYQLSNPTGVRKVTAEDEKRKVNRRWL